ncbi:MAG: hypothetical protein IPM82_26920 [Saprospiraceae bacterium]|nr:hypothetical protein [Saprospiraceae bacterium]
MRPYNTPGYRMLPSYLRGEPHQHVERTTAAQPISCGPSLSFFALWAAHHLRVDRYQVFERAGLAEGADEHARHHGCRIRAAVIVFGLARLAGYFPIG